MKKITALLLLLCLLLCGCQVTEVPPATTTAATVTDSSGCLTVHFIDVGQADCALIDVGGAYVLIDGGNKEDGQLVVSYLEQQGVEELEAVICTHAHEDHVGGLPSVLAVYPTKAVYAPTKTYSSNVFDDFLYYVDQQGLEVTIPQPGDRFSVYGDTTYGAEFTIVGPTQSYADTNNTSIVLMVEFHNHTFFFTGDMEISAENDMLDYWDGAIDWNVDVLKVGHHGSDTSTSYRLVNELMPTYGVISVGEGNSYGHPCEEPLTRLKQAGVTLFRTDELGTVIIRSDGTELTITWEDQSAQPEDVESAEETCYVGNKNSKKFHTEDCSNLPKEENRVYFDSYQDAIDAGYTPCGSCLG